MAESIMRRIVRVFRPGTERSNTQTLGPVVTESRSYRSGRTFSSAGERSFITSIYTRIGIDVSQNDIRHVRLDANGRYKANIDSQMHRCFQLSANIDQTGRAFFEDAALSLFDYGVIAIVPVDTVGDPFTSDGYDIETMRIGQVLEFRPKHVLVRLYDENVGYNKDIWIPKNVAAVVENPLYPVVNAPNSTFQRLVRKLTLLDITDDTNNSGKLDIIIQLPYTIRSDARRDQAEKRRTDIEMQLRTAKYGIAYTDATEKVTQLNRPAENNLLTQIEGLKSELFYQMGMAKEIFDGTADERTMLNYHNRTIKPLMDALVDSMTRTFLSKTALTQGQAIRFFRDPFASVPVSDFAQFADKMTRNEILSPNEIRAVIGMAPSNDPKSDELRNRNITAPGAMADASVPAETQLEGDEKPSVLDTPIVL